MFEDLADDVALSGVRFSLVDGGLFSAEAAGLIGVETVIADKVFALVGDVLGEFGQEVEGLEDIEVAGGGAEEVCAGRFGEAMGSLLLNTHRANPLQMPGVFRCYIRHAIASRASVGLRH